MELRHIKNNEYPEHTKNAYSHYRNNHRRYRISKPAKRACKYLLYSRKKIGECLRKKGINLTGKKMDELVDEISAELETEK